MAKIADIFQCSRWGDCCRTKITVPLDEDDRRRMAAHLGLSVWEAHEKYWQTSGNVVRMKVVDGRCIFYDDGCAIYDGRPRLCAQWPLHPAILDDEDNLKIIRDTCPGINQEMPYDEFCRILRES
ncbi:MAG: YkgJ family cysteine cluster protein [Chloroflexi bacterium]|nr:YkgJ family cysteine cluster protein [Chloroflexota bacterium]